MINPRRLECNDLLYLTKMLNTAFSFANLMTIKKKKWTITFFNFFKIGMPGRPTNGRGMRAKEVKCKFSLVVYG